MGCSHDVQIEETTKRNKKKSKTTNIQNEDKNIKIVKTNSNDFESLNKQNNFNSKSPIIAKNSKKGIENNNKYISKEIQKNKNPRKSEVLNNNLNLNNENIDEILQNLNIDEENNQRKNNKRNSNIYNREGQEGEPISESDEKYVNSSDLSSSSIHENNE